MCACGRRRGTVGAAVRRHGGNARQEGRRINGKGGEARKERHGKERRHGGRPRQRTAEHWAAGQTTEHFCLGGYHAGVGRVGLGPPVGVFPLFTLEFSQQKKKFSAEITMSTLPKWVIWCL